MTPDYSNTIRNLEAKLARQLLAAESTKEQIEAFKTLMTKTPK